MNYELLFGERVFSMRDSANSPLERGLGVCYGAVQELRFDFVMQCKARPYAKQFIIK
jgi:hypothetical protein